MNISSKLENFHTYFRSQAKNKHEAISPTAWLVAYRRAFSDIPYAKAISKGIEKYRLNLKMPELPDEYKFLATIPLFEARHKLVHGIAKSLKCDQILDIAAGLSPHGLELTKAKTINYVEFDLPEMIAEKKKIVGWILKKNKAKRENLHFVSGNGLIYADLEKALKYFNKHKPITVITEGLLRYFDEEEKKQISKNIYKILTQYGGYWVTPDIIYKRKLNKEAQENSRRVAEMTGVDIENNKFESVAQAKSFFKSLGYIIKTFKFVDVLSQLVSHKKISLTLKEAKRVIKHRVVFVMKIK